MAIAPTRRSHDVFISYSSFDASIARTVCATLERNGIGCWMAPRDVSAGETWAEAIIGAIKTCRVMVFVFSSHSNTSDNTVREVERAARYKLTIIPFRIERVPPSRELEYFISAAHWLDATDGILDEQMALLVSTVSQKLRPGSAVESPGVDLPSAPPPSWHQPLRTTRTARPLLWVLIGGFGGVLALAVVVLFLAAITPDQPSLPPGTTAPTDESQSTVVQGLAERAVARIQQGDPDGAIKDLTAAIRVAPDADRLYAFRAQAYELKKMDDAAICDWNTFVQLAPLADEGYSRRGQCYLRKSDFDRAIADFRKVLELDPASWLGYELMGDAYRKKGDPRRAMEYYTAELAHDPQYPAGVYFYLSQAASQMGATAQAKAYLVKARDLDPNVTQRLSGN